MGVKIAKTLPKKEISISELAGKTLIVDGHNILYQFLTTIRDMNTGEPFCDSSGNVTSHLSGLFYRCSNLLAKEIKLIFVFDGERPELKLSTVNMRRDAKEKAMEKLNEAKESGDLKAILKHSSATTIVDKAIVDDAKKLLGLMGIPCVQAPGEGEAQASHMVSKGDGWAVMSQDADTLLFGATRLVKNVSVTGRRKLPGRNIWVDSQPELITLETVLKEAEITREQLIIMSMLVGTDYNPQGIMGIGPAKALKIIKEEKTLENVLKKVDWTFECDPKEVFELFVKPNVTSAYTIKFSNPDIEKIRKFLIVDREFSKERIDNTLKKLEDLKKKKQQTRLFGW